MCASLKETYAPVILQKKAAKLRLDTGDERYWSRYDQKLSSQLSVWMSYSHKLTVTVFQLLKINLSRPFVMTFTEPILWFWDAYIAVSTIWHAQILSHTQLYKENRNKLD